MMAMSQKKDNLRF
uniref:Uncharacterized protein n=1 Tax=Rhizophora mucronata TaxID=61149 RepID=A0A2P2KPF0_RHIMU